MNIKSVSSLVVLIILCSSVVAQQKESDSLSVTIVQDLWPDGAPGALGTEAKDKPTLTHYVANSENRTKAAIVILPGGGYGGLAVGHEGHDIARWCNEMGVSAFICEYRHRGRGYGHPAPLQDAQRAIRTVRHNANKFGIDPTKIGIIGFSAGGHLASTTATHFDAGLKDSADPIQKVSSRPDFAILCYPVIAFDQPYTHKGSQRNLLGADADKKLVESLSNEKQVTSETPPTFLFHTHEDTAVPPQNSVVFYLALKEAGVPAELHLYQKGRHGVGLAKNMPATGTWSDRCKDWLKGLGVLEK